MPVQNNFDPQGVYIVVFPADRIHFLQVCLVGLLPVLFLESSDGLRGKALSIQGDALIDIVLILRIDGHILRLIAALRMPGYRDVVRAIQAVVLHHIVEITGRLLLLAGGGLRHAEAIVQPFAVAGSAVHHIYFARIGVCKRTGPGAGVELRQIPALVADLIIPNAVQVGLQDCKLILFYKAFIFFRVGFDGRNDVCQRIVFTGILKPQVKKLI